MPETQEEVIARLTARVKALEEERERMLRYIMDQREKLSGLIDIITNMWSRGF